MEHGATISIIISMNKKKKSIILLSVNNQRMGGILSSNHMEIILDSTYSSVKKKC